MASQTLLNDRALMRRRDAVALDRGKDHFLLAHIAGDLSDRIAGMTAEYPKALDISPRAGVLPVALSSTAKISNWVQAPSGVSAPLSGHHPGSKRAQEVVADEEWLPFKPASFDLVVSGLGLHRVNDLPGALLQINRALVPDGLFLAALFAGSTLSELRAVMTEAETEVSGGASPRVMPFADVAALGQLMQRAGFALPVADTERLTVRYAHLFDLIADLRAMGESNALHARTRKPLTRRVFQKAAEIYADRFADPDGRIRATFDIVTLTGWHPHGSQQQPLKPGSASVSLADALVQAKAPEKAR